MSRTTRFVVCAVLAVLVAVGVAMFFSHMDDTTSVDAALYLAGGALLSVFSGLALVVIAP